MSYDLEYSDNITTNDDMKHFKGIDLEEENGPQDDVGNAVKRQINDVELWLIDYCTIYYSFSGSRSTLSDFQKEYFKRAVCEEIDYILDNGDLRGLSGVNQETYQVIDLKALEKRGLAPNAKLCLRRCGMANIKRY